MIDSQEEKKKMRTFVTSPCTGTQNIYIQTKSMTKKGERSAIDEMGGGKRERGERREGGRGGGGVGGGGRWLGRITK